MPESPNLFWPADHAWFVASGTGTGVVRNRKQKKACLNQASEIAVELSVT